MIPHFGSSLRQLISCLFADPSVCTSNDDHFAIESGTAFTPSLQIEYVFKNFCHRFGEQEANVSDRFNQIHLFMFLCLHSSVANHTNIIWFGSIAVKGLVYCGVGAISLSSAIIQNITMITTSYYISGRFACLDIML